MNETDEQSYVPIYMDSRELKKALTKASAPCKYSFSFILQVYKGEGEKVGLHTFTRWGLVSVSPGDSLSYQIGHTIKEIVKKLEEEKK